MNFSLKRNSKQHFKFYCEHCHHWVQGDKRDISTHNNSQKHRQRFQKALEQKNLNSARDRAKMGYTPENATPENPLGNTPASIYRDPKAEKKAEAQKKWEEIQAKRASQHLEKQTKQKDRTLAAQGISLKMSSQISKKMKSGEMGKSMGQVWDIVVDDETQKICWMNALTLEKHFTKPIGLKISDEQSQLWELNKDKVFFIFYFFLPLCLYLFF
jgi:hypothetical protein